MADPEPKARSWLVDFVPDEIRMRCSYKRVGKRIVQYTVQLEIRIGDDWRPVVRYDNAHGFCHRDTVHPDGSQEKVPVFYGSANDTFTHAIDDLRANWEAQRARYLGEIKNV